METKNLIKQIETRRKELQHAAGVLKDHFVGLDATIDRIVQSIETWYVLPEIISRPLIINLWGLTGTGKTDLVRCLVKELKFHDRFLEIGMDTTSDNSEYSDSDTIKSLLLSSSINENEAGIVLLDEFQNFRTLNNLGHDVQHEQKRFQDVWMLLSDGKFTNNPNGKNSLIELLLEALSREDRNETDSDEDGPYAYELNTKKAKEKKKPTKEKRFHMCLWEAQTFKKSLKLTESLEEIMTWGIKTRIERIYNSMKEETYCNGESYNKLLIFICGNLDEAYEIAGVGECSNADVDADTLHDFSKQINVVTIKDALATRFKPEQIARLGNTHIIYPALSKASFQKIIAKHVNRIRQSIKNTININITIDKSIEDVIYLNGVYPSQGVRPVFSTISSVLENNLPKFILLAFENSIDNLHITYANEYLTTIVNGKEYQSEKINLDLDAIKKGTNSDQQAYISAHEAGHAVAYSVLFGYAPVQIKSNLSLFEGGYILKHRNNTSKAQLIKDIQVALAGQAAEQFVFGEMHRSSGSQNDIINATTTASNMVRKYRMDKWAGSFRSEGTEESEIYLTNIADTNLIINNILNVQRQTVTKLLRKHKSYLKVVMETLFKQGEIKPEAFVTLSKPFIGDIKILNAKETLFDNYHEMFQKFLKSA